MGAILNLTPNAVKKTVRITGGAARREKITLVLSPVTEEMLAITDLRAVLFYRKEIMASSTYFADSEISDSSSEVQESSMESVINLQTEAVSGAFGNSSVGSEKLMQLVLWSESSQWMVFYGEIPVINHLVPSDVPIIPEGTDRYLRESLVVNTLTSTSTKVPLSANMGRALKSLIDNIPDTSILVTNHNSSITAHDDIRQLISQSGAGLALGVTSTTAYRGDHGLTAYNHSQEEHAPSDAQKNSDITKTEIEAKLTGEISSHTHTDSGGFANPMTTAGDIIVGSTDGVPVRLPKGADGKVLGVESGAVAWVTPTGGVGNLPIMFTIPSTLEGDPALHFAIEFHETDDYSGAAVYSIDTAVSQTGMKVFDGSAWVAFPADGAGTIFYGNQIKIEYNEAMGGTPKNVRYKLYLKSDDPTGQPWKYTAYPAVGGADGADGTSFEVTETGLLAGLSAHDAEPKGFTYLATDTGDLYIKQSNTSGDWSNPVPIQGPQGPAGADGDVSVATAKKIAMLNAIIFG